MAVIPSVLIAVSPDTAIAYPSEPALITAEVDTSAASDGATVVNYTFTWGDGSLADTVIDTSQTHQYTLAGTYNVSLTVLDSAGLTATSAKQVRIYREDVQIPQTPVEIPPKDQHVPLDTLRPAYRLRRGTGSNGG